VTEPLPPPEVARIAVRLTPRGRADRIDGWLDGELRVRVSATAIDGRANEALLRLLARALNVPPNRVAIIHGERSRRKQLAVSGLSQDEAKQRLKRSERRGLTAES